MTELIKPGLVMAALGGIRYLDVEDPTVLLYARVGFVVCVLISWALLGLIYLRIQSRNDTAPLHCTETDLDPNAAGPLAFITGQTEGGKPVETTNKAYDLLKLQQVVKQGLLTPAIVLALHLYFGFFPPLIIQALLTLANTLTSELSRVHLLSLLSSAPPAKELKRPWRVKGLLASMRDMKKEVMKELKEVKGKDGQSGSRKNKKNENRRKIGRT